MGAACLIKRAAVVLGKPLQALHTAPGCTVPWPAAAPGCTGRRNRSMATQATPQEPRIPINQSALRSAGTLRVIFALLTVKGLAVPAVAPLLLVYADLMASNEGRSVEVAGMLMEWLKNAEDAGLVSMVAACLI